MEFCIFSKSYDTGLLNPPPKIWQQIRALKCVRITFCVSIAINVITEKQHTENNLSLEQSSYRRRRKPCVCFCVGWCSALQCQLGRLTVNCEMNTDIQR